MADILQVTRPGTGKREDDVHERWGASTRSKGRLATVTDAKA